MEDIFNDKVSLINKEIDDVKSTLLEAQRKNELQAE
jgi:hypothetical protein